MIWIRIFTQLLGRTHAPWNLRLKITLIYLWLWITVKIFKECNKRKIYIILSKRLWGSVDRTMGNNDKFTLNFDQKVTRKSNNCPLLGVLKLLSIFERQIRLPISGHWIFQCVCWRCGGKISYPIFKSNCYQQKMYYVKTIHIS